MDMHHLHRRELVEHGAGGQPRGAPAGEILQRDVQAVGDEGDEDVRLDAAVLLVGDPR